MPQAGDQLVVAFSGGPDSAALLHALGQAGLWKLLAIHVDHAMRSDSASDAVAAGRLAGAFGVECRVVRLDKPPAGETQARAERHAILADIARETGAAAIALGHTADDQLETLLLHLARGTGLKGLRGMSDWEMGPAGVRVTRPLLALTRREIEHYVQIHGIPALQDPSNFDPAFADRNRVRLGAVPALREINPRITQAVARLSRLVAEDDEALDAWAAREYDALAEQSGAPGVFALRQFRALPLAIRRRLVRRAAPGLSYEQVEQVLGLAANQAAGHTHLPGGRVAVRSKGRLEIGPAPPPEPSECRICLTQGGLVPSMEREIGNQQGPFQS